MHHLLEVWSSWVLHGGYVGIIVLMAMESSIFPVPSEIVIPPAAFLAAQGHLNFWGVIVAGTVGSYLGSAITYWVSRAVGRPLVLRYGRFFFLRPEKLERAETWLIRYETGGVFFARLLPVVRHLISIPEILEIEKRTNHDVIAFLENVATSVGPAARWIHQGLTSSDILDTTLAVQLTEACRILSANLKDLRAAVATQARKYKTTPMIGRSHGIHAEPITFGLKLALMYDEFGRAEERLAQTTERIRVGKLSGAVGTHAHLDPAIERAVCERLGLKPATLSTQVVQRDRHAEFCTTLALIASSIDRWATEFRHLQRTEVLEVEEFFGEGQKGSSAMPHKRNPITGERLSGLARVIRGNAVAALENVALWHERDISHSSAERIILPDSCILLDYMLDKLRDLVAKLQVYPDRMLQNLGLTKGLYCSQSILLALTRKGAERKTAYEAVQRAAMKTWKGNESFAANAKREPEIKASLSDSEIDELCSLETHFRHVDETFRALGLE